MNWLETLDISVKVLAVLIGGVWVLINYLRGRTHKPRLQLRVYAERAFRDGLEYLIIRNELRNVGLSRVKIVHDGCSVAVCAHRLPKKVESVMEPKWEEPAFFDLYKDQNWVEPNGLLLDQQLVAVPGLADRFLRVWAHVESAKVAWNAYAIAGHVAPIGLATRTE